jgi:hypothetical protein
MGQKIVTSIIDKNNEDNIRFHFYMFMMRLIGDRIYSRYSEKGEL